MTDDREHDDPAGWFAAQFGAHDDDAKNDDAANNDDSGGDAAGGDDTSADAKGGVAPHGARPTSAAHPVSPVDPVLLEGAGERPTAPSTPASGGFNWGLKPSNAAAQPPAAPASPASPEPPVEPPVADEPVQPPVRPGEPAVPPVAVPPVAVPPVAVPSAGTPPVVTPPVAAPPAAPPFEPPAPVSAATSPFAPPPLATPPLTPPPLATPPLVEPPLPATSVFTPPPLVVPPVTPPVVAPTEPQPFDAALAGGPSTEAEPPTVAMPWEGPATELFAPPVASASVAEPATELLGGFGPGAGASAEGSPVDALFGESQFREYETGSLAAVVPAKSRKNAQPPRPPRAPIPRSQQVLFWIAGSLAALLVLVALFFLGTKLPRAETAPAAVAIPKASATPTPSPTPTVLPAGPLAAGSYKWDQLLGGECLEPFTSPWAEKFTVVDCTVPHPAQMVARGVFAETPPAAGDGSAPATPSVGGEASSYPGADALQAQINLLCTTPGVIDFAAAGAYNDIQILGSYPATDKQWADGERSYFCFVTRSSGEPLTGSVAAPKAP